MRFHESEAFVLDVAPLGDHDRVVTLLTRDAGRKRGVARGARRRYSRFAGELQLLAKVAAHWFEKEGRELGRLSQIELLRPPPAVLADLEGILLGSYLAEAAGELAPEDESGELIFRLLEASLEALDGGGDRATVARYFETWGLRLAGVFPPPSECALCGRELGDRVALAAEGQGFLCGECAARAPGAQPIGGGALAFLRRSAREPVSRLAAAGVEAAALQEVERLAATVRRQFLQRELKSYLVMARTLAATY